MQHKSGTNRPQIIASNVHSLKINLSITGFGTLDQCTFVPAQTISLVAQSKQKWAAPKWENQRGELMECIYVCQLLADTRT